MNAIQEFTEAYGKAFESGDVEQVMALVTDDFVALTPDKPPLVGCDAVRREIANDLGMMKVARLQFIHEDVKVSEPWAFAWGRTDGMVLMGGDEVSVAGTYLWVLKKQEDGSWKLARDSAHGE